MKYFVPLSGLMLYEKKFLFTFNPIDCFKSNAGCHVWDISHFEVVTSAGNRGNSLFSGSVLHNINAKCSDDSVLSFGCQIVML